MNKFILLILIFFVFWGCGTRTPQKPPVPDQVTAHTSGLISRYDSLRILFAKPVPAIDREAFLAQSPIKLDPPVAGQLQWSDETTLVFTPAKPWEPGKSYWVGFHPQVSSLNDFEFGFRAMTQRLHVTLEPLSADKDPAKVEIRGRLETTDRTEDSLVEKAFTAGVNGKSLAVHWNHQGTSYSHEFVVSDISKEEKESFVDLRWEGSPLRSPDSGQERVTVPAKNTFQVLASRGEESGGSKIQLVFSEPLNPKQDLRGLVTVDGQEKIQYLVQGNTLNLFNEKPWSGTNLVKISRGIQSISGRTLAAVTERSVNFDNPAPSVKFVGTGAILPTTQGLTVPIETVNVDSVMVEALQVFDDNVLQFFQVNNHDGRRELKRVGRVVWKQVIPLDFKPEDADKAVRRGLDVSPLLKKFSKGFFVLKLTIHRQNIRWGSHIGAQEFKDDPVQWDPQFQSDYGDSENSFWDYWEGQDSENIYKERDNPLTLSYYLPRWDHSTVAVRNVMVSDIGLGAKKSDDGTLMVYVSDLKTAQPKADVPLSVYDFQKQPVWTGKSDKNGLASFKPGIDPAFVVASLGSQNGYLKLDPSLQLSMSSFDVGGEKIEKGLNGYLYGERGVWRPGDPIYLSFIMEDPAKLLPLNIPVVMELKDPQGQVVAKQVKTLGVNGFYTFKTGTSDDAPTGTWIARVSVAGKVFEKELKIETIMPNRLKIELNWQNADKGLGLGTWKGTLFSRWLHGGKASNLEAETKVVFDPIPTTFARWKDYDFDDPAKQFQSSMQNVFSGHLDGDGNASVEASIDQQFSSPGKLLASFHTKVFEPSGVFSTTSQSVEFNPYRQYVGIQLPKGDPARGMLLTDTDHTARFVLVDPQGNPVPQGRLKVSLIKLNWRWWWEKSGENLPQYIARSEYQTIQTGEVSVRDGQAQWNFRLAYPDWGRFMVRAEDSQGHSTGRIVYIDWPGWAGRSKGEGSGAANILSLSTDRPKYKVGETVSLTIPSNPQGKAFVLIEAGGKILKTEWVDSSKDQTTVYTFTATSDMAPNAYAHVTYLQPHQQTANDLPIRLYGAVPVMVEDPASHLTPLIITESRFEPSSKAKITVKEASGKPMTYTLALVDEGLLGITNFKTADPWKTFFRRQASLLRSWDLYDWVSGAWTGSLQNILTIGGDGDFSDASKVKKNRFPPVVRFLEPTVLAPGETKTHEIDLPPYIGEVRIMVVAGYKRAYGAAEKSVPVTSPVMALPTLPRVLSPGENFQMPVSVFAYENPGKTEVSVQVSGPLTLQGPAVQVLDMSKSGEALVNFPLQTEKQTGAAQVKVKVSNGTYSNTQVINLAVRIPAAVQTQVQAGPYLKPGESWQVSAAPFGFDGTNKWTLEVSQIKPLDMERRLSWLIQYPHGCIEQTTSSVFPQLYLDKVVFLPDDRKKQVQANIAAGIDRLRVFQTADGGFAYWPGESQSNGWGTNYAGHFLLEAKKAGFAVPADLLTRWSAYQKKTADLWVDAENPSSQLEQAYRLYLLAQAGAADLPAMNRFKELKLPDPALMYLAVAYQSTGLQDVSSQLVSQAGTQSLTYSEAGETYGSEIRDQAILLTSLVDLKNWTAALSVYDKISEALAKPDWMSTQTTAYALMACSRFVERQFNGKTAKAVVKVGDQESKTDFGVPVYTLTGALESETPLVVTNTGSVPLTPRLLVSANPLPVAEKTEREGLNLTCSFDPDKGKLTDSPLGTKITVTFKVYNSSWVEQKNLALTFLAPSGWELENPRLAGNGSTDGAEYQDFRDDRVMTYFSLGRGESKTFTFQATAAYAGTFYLPTVQVESMYDGHVYARQKGQWIKIGQDR